MKKVKKYTTSEDLKSSENKPLDDALRLKVQEAFENVFKDLEKVKARKGFK